MISDEIYHGLDYAVPAETALRLSERAVVINSFSKYFCMTGWRIGWMVVPEPLVRPIERLQGNLAISVPTLSQIAAEAAFDGRAEMEAIKHGYEENRRILIEGLPQAGLDRFLPVDGAFYLYADVSRFSNDSFDFAKRLLQEAHVAATPGRRLRSGQRQPLRALLLRRLGRRHARGGGADRRLAAQTLNTRIATLGLRGVPLRKLLLFRGPEILVWKRRLVWSLDDDKGVIERRVTGIAAFGQTRICGVERVSDRRVFVACSRALMGASIVDLHHVLHRIVAKARLESGDFCKRILELMNAVCGEWPIPLSAGNTQFRMPWLHQHVHEIAEAGNEGLQR